MLQFVGKGWADSDTEWIKSASQLGWLAVCEGVLWAPPSGGTQAGKTELLWLSDTESLERGDNSPTAASSKSALGSASLMVELDGKRGLGLVVTGVCFMCSHNSHPAMPLTANGKEWSPKTSGPGQVNNILQQPFTIYSADGKNFNQRENLVSLVECNMGKSC